MSGPGTLVVVLTVAAAVGCGAVGGVFFAFSTFVMPALARLAPAQGVAAMQSVNVAAVRPAFMALLFGTAALAAGLGVHAALTWGDGRSGPVLAAAVLYLVGTVGVTVAVNVPRNDALARVEPGGAAAAQAWSRFLPGWTAANHVRTATALAASVLLAVALRT
jgi:uncharacterized membrane protein